MPDPPPPFPSLPIPPPWPPTRVLVHRPIPHRAGPERNSRPLTTAAREVCRKGDLRLVNSDLPPGAVQISGGPWTRSQGSWNHTEATQLKRPLSCCWPALSLGGGGLGQSYISVQQRPHQCSTVLPPHSSPHASLTTRITHHTHHSPHVLLTTPHAPLSTMYIVVSAHTHTHTHSHETIHTHTHTHTTEVNCCKVYSDNDVLLVVGWLVGGGGGGGGGGSGGGWWWRKKGHGCTGGRWAKLVTC